MIGKVISMDSGTRKIKIEEKGEIKEYTVGKAIFNQRKFQEGDTIEYIMKGPNFEFKKKIEGTEKNNQNKNNQNRNNQNNRNNNKKKTEEKEYFVPFGDEVLKKGKVKYGDKSGILKCVLKNLTPMSVSKYDERYIVTASTLKGEIRNLIDILTDSRVKNLKNLDKETDKKEFENMFLYKNEKSNAKQKKLKMIGEYENNPLKFIPKQFLPTNIEENFSFSERLFGKTVEENTGENIEDPKNYMGRIFFTDAVAIKELVVKKDVELELMEPKPKFDDAQKYVKGRKLYTRKENITLNGIDSLKKGSNEKIRSKVDVAKENSEFKFEIRFNNLTDEELGILIYAVMLDGSTMTHQIGRGKGLGLGKIKIQIKECLIENKEEKYNSFSTKKLYKTGEKQSFIKKAEEEYKLNSRENVKYLKNILRGV